MLKKRLIFLMFLVIILYLPALSSAEPIDNWYLRHSSQCSECQLNSITFGNNTFVAVGNTGTILSSHDGLTWTEENFMDSGTIEDLNGVAYGNDVFVAVGNHGTILVSPDGEVWTEITPYSGTVNDLTAIAYGKGLFVAVANHDYVCQSNVLTSTDGYNWEESNIDSTSFPNFPTSITYGKRTFVVVGEGGNFSTSNDGVTWELSNIGIPVNLSDITFGNGMFVAIDSDGLIWTSVDAITWELRNSGISCQLKCVAYGNLLFVAVVDGACAPALFRPDFIITSTDGISWTERSLATDGSYNDLAYGKKTFVAAGAGANGGAEIIQSDIISNAPSPLTAKAISSSSIVLTWQDNSDNETGFKIERKSGTCGSGNPWNQIATTAENVTSRTNTGLSPATTYSFRVRAYNAGMNFDYSNCASATTGVAGSPNAATNLKATSVSGSKISLAWTDKSTDETGFKIYRKAGAGLWKLLATTAANVKRYSDALATGNDSTKTYSYRVKACTGSVCSPSTNTAVVPYKPTDLTATPISSSQIDLTWADNSDNEAGFKVYRKSGACSSTNSWSLITMTGSNVSSYSNSDLHSGRTYSYRVKAYTSSLAKPYANGYSGNSNCISATTP
jgi:hypothetical protein